MSAPILATKLYIPPTRPIAVRRPRLIERLNAGLSGHKLALISAAAGFGKTTLISEWVVNYSQSEPKVRAAWLSLDEGDNEPTRFLTYLIAALQTIEASIGKGAASALQSPQPPPTETILTALINEIAAISEPIALVLDDYHLIEAQPIHDIFTFLLKHLPPQINLVIATREDPPLPLARLRAQGQLTELRAADLRFTSAEAAEFLNQAMGLNLSTDDIDALEDRIEGWIADLQLAALALQGPLAFKGRTDTARFIQAFTGSHRFVLDYLIEEVLQQQTESVQTFLPCGTIAPILDWLASLPKTVLDTRPSLWVKSATLSWVAGQTTGVEEKLQAAEAAIGEAAAAEAAIGEAAAAEAAIGEAAAAVDDRTRNLIGVIAAARATLALTRYQSENIIIQARRALKYLPPNNLTFRFTAMWTMAVAHLYQGDRAAAIQAYEEAVSISQASGDTWSTILATSGLAEVQALENQLHQAAETYRRVLQLHGDHPQPNAGEDYLGLARILYEWNDLEAAEQHGQQGLHLARQYDRVIDRFVICEVFLARLKLARGDVAGAAAMLAETSQIVRRRNFVHRKPEVAAAQVLVLLRQGNRETAADLAETHELPLSQARVHLARGGRPLPWRFCGHCASRWRPRAGTMNDSM